jgi:secreted trypsin-like serine protease
MRYLLTCLAVIGLTAATTATSAALVGMSQAGGPALAHTVVVVRNHGNTAGVCSGVVLGPRIVLTAAHCVKPATYIGVLVNPNSQEPVFARSVSVHPQYVAGAERKRVVSIDLAMIRLEKPLPPQFRPIALETNPLVRLDQEFSIAGFGLREENGASATELRYGKLVTRSPLSNILLWAADPNRAGFGACTGDSGGPIFDAGVTKLVAITVWSAGAGVRKCGDLTQGVLVAPQRAWIDKIMQQWGAR